MVATVVACTAMTATIAPAGAAADVAPCAQTAGRPWCDTKLSADKRAGLLLKALTQDEKISLIAGASAGVHTGATAAIPRVGLPSSYMTDGPVGIRQGSATAMPAPMALAATFDPAMAALYGATVGQEAKAKGNLGVLGPTVNMMRTPEGGRTFEAFGEDPFLVTRTTVKWIEGAQSQGVYATVKHYAANNQEGSDPTGVAASSKLPLGVGLLGARYIENSIIDERTLREIYLPQFEAAVKEAHVGAVMCSYNRVGGDWACANQHLLNQILKGDWGFDGMVMSDWVFASHIFDVSKHLANGMDLEMPTADAYLPAAVQLATVGANGRAALDDHVRRILTTLFRFGFFDAAPHAPDDAQIDKAAHAAASERIAESAITLLKNDKLLPLDASKHQSIAVVGPYASRFLTGGGSGNVSPFSSVTALQGIKDRVGSAAKVSFDDGSNPASAASVAKAADVAVVVVGQYQTEGSDRSCMTLECPNDAGDQDGLVDAVLAAQPNTIVVLETGGPVLTPWRNKAKAIVEAWMAGDQGGTALARILFGDAEVRGRLPVTFPQSYSQEQVAGDTDRYPGDLLQNVRYSEGVLAGYRWFDAKHFEPAFPFGAGLSYTSFALNHFKLKAATKHALGATVTFRVNNTGARRGVAVPQLYLGVPGSSRIVQPPRKLAGYAKLSIASHHTKTVKLRIDQRALSYWDVGTSSWEVAKGCYSVMIGRSSRDITRTMTLAVRGASCPGAAASIPK